MKSLRLVTDGVPCDARASGWRAAPRRSWGVGRGWVVGFLASLSVFLAGPVLATNTNTQVQLSQTAVRTVTAQWGSSSQMWREWANAGLFPSHAATSPLGNVLATTRHKGPSPIVGEVIDVDIKRNLPWSSISKAVGKALPLVSTAIAIAEIAEAIRCREAPGSGAECDLGTPEVTETITPWGATVSGQTCSGHVTSQSAFNCAVAKRYPGTTVNMGGNPQLLRTETGTPSACVKTSGQHSCNYSVTRTDTYPAMPAWNTTTTFPTNAGSVGQEAQTSIQKCPDIAVGGGTITPVKGIDGKCPTLVYTPATETDVGTRAETWGDKTKAPAIVGDLLNGGRPIDHPFPEVDPVPASITGPRETTTHPDGSTTTRDTRYDLAPTPTGYGWVPTVITKDWAPGVTPSPPGEVTDGTSTSGGNAPERDIITCGLPDTPPCKLDETGTPSAPADTSSAVASGLVAGITACVVTPSSCLPALPDINWSFSVPTSCAPIPLGGGYGEWLDSIDICPYQPIIHDIMSMLWAGAGLFGAVSMMFKGSH